VSKSLKKTAPVGSDAEEADADAAVKFASGMFFATIALIGNTGVSALRKILSKKNVLSSAEQVGFAKTIQAVGQFGFLYYHDILKIPGVCGKSLSFVFTGR
jgi:hypothetical protein